MSSRVRCLAAIEDLRSAASAIPVAFRARSRGKLDSPSYNASSSARIVSAFPHRINRGLNSAAVVYRSQPREGGAARRGAVVRGLYVRRRRRVAANGGRTFSADTSAKVVDYRCHVSRSPGLRSTRAPFGCAPTINRPSSGSEADRL